MIDRTSTSSQALAQPHVQIGATPQIPGHEGKKSPTLQDSDIEYNFAAREEEYNFARHVLERSLGSTSSPPASFSPRTMPELVRPPLANHPFVNTNGNGLKDRASAPRLQNSFNCYTSETKLHDRATNLEFAPKLDEPNAKNLVACICAEIEQIVKRELDASVQGLKEWMLESHHEILLQHESNSSDAGISNLKLELSESSDMKLGDAHPCTSAENRYLEGVKSRWGGAEIMEEEPVALVDKSTQKLLLAVRNHNGQKVQKLLGKKADPNLVVHDYQVRFGKTWRSCPILAVAVHEQNLEIVRLLVKSQADLEARYSFLAGSLQMEWSGSIIQAAVPTRNLRLLKELIALSADPHDVSSNNANLIWQSCYFRAEDMVEYLLDLGVNPNVAAKSQDHVGLSLTPLHVATRRGCAGIVEKLLSAHVLITETEEGSTALHDALGLWYPGCAYYLIKGGAELVEAEPNPRRRISIATDSGHKYFERTLDMLFSIRCPIVVASAARGLQHQEEQVKRLRIDDILTFLSRNGQASLELLQALFRERRLRYRIPSLSEVEVKSALIPFWSKQSKESFLNVYSTNFSYDEFEHMHMHRKEPTEDMKIFLADFVPKVNRKRVVDYICPRRRAVVPIAVYHSLIPDFHNDLRILATLSHCEDLDLFGSRPCQAILGEAWCTVREVVALEAFLSFVWILIDVFFALEVHSACDRRLRAPTVAEASGTGGAPWHFCFGFPLHVYVILSVPFSSTNLLSEAMIILAHIRLGWLRGYLRCTFGGCASVARLAVVALSSGLLTHLMVQGEDAFETYGYFTALLFALSNLAKWFHFMMMLMPFRHVGRPMMPVVQSFIGLFPLIRVFVLLATGFINFWACLNVGNLGFFDYIPNALYFGMTADFGSVDDFRHPDRFEIMMHSALVLMTLWVPVIFMNCTIASMSTDYAHTSDNVEQYYQRFLSRFVFRHAAVRQMYSKVLGLKLGFAKSPSYLWYAFEIDRTYD